MARTKRSRLTEGHKHWMLHRLARFINSDVLRTCDFDRAYHTAEHELIVESRGKKFRLTLTEIRK